MTPAGSSTVQVDAVSKRFRSRVALNEVSLRIGRGMTGLLGPNGAGKTTLLRILATTMSPDDGMVRIFGRDPAQEGDRLEIRRTLGYLPQEVGIYGDFTAFDFVDYVAILKEMTDTRRRRDDVRRVLTTVGLGDRMHAKIRTLSGGMRRRVGLAQALLGTPRLLILDEPTVRARPGATAQVPRDGVGAGVDGDRGAVHSSHRGRGRALYAGHRARSRPDPVRWIADGPGSRRGRVRLGERCC